MLFYCKDRHQTIKYLSINLCFFFIIWLIGLNLAGQKQSDL